jgi:hypothetical protein
MPAVPGMTAPHRGRIEHTFLDAVHHQQQHCYERQQQNCDENHGAPSADTGERVLRSAPLMGVVM